MFTGADMQLAVLNSAVSKVLKLYFPELSILVGPPGFRGAAYWVRHLGIRKYDIVFDTASIEQVHYTRWLAYLLSRGQRVGYHYGSSSWLYNTRLKTGFIKDKHQVDIFSHFLSPFVEVSGRVLEVPGHLSLQNPVIPSEERLRVVIHPGGRDHIELFEKRWPVEYYRELIKLIKTSHKAQIVIVGTKSENSWIENTLREELDDNTLNFAGKTDISQLFSIISSGCLFIGNNSGPMHIAAAYGVPVVTFAGGIDINRWSPAGTGPYRILGLDKICPECTHYQCSDHGKPCLEATTVAEAFTAVQELLPPLASSTSAS